MIESEICTIKDLIFNGNQDPDHPAIESPGYQPLTYRELRMQITSFVKTLNSRGVSRNDRIAIVLPGGPEMAVALLSVEAGFTAAPLNPEYKEHEYEMYFSKLGINGIIVQKDYHTAARSVARSHSIPVIEIFPLMDKAGSFDLIVPISTDSQKAAFARPSDTALLLLTSGTTSTPKTVPFSQEQICEITRTYLKSFHKEDPNILRFLHCVTFYHAIGILGSFLGPLSTGGTVICVKNFIAPDFIHLVNTYQPTYYWAVPALHQSILHEIKKNPARVKKQFSHVYGNGSSHSAGRCKE
jgi:acyl-CoA synthetase (AMP-forming)/AMP-acid ligase II